MHQSAFDHMAQCVEEYVPTTGRLRIVEVGSRQRQEPDAAPTGSSSTRYDCEYIGVDVVEGANVDRVMRKPYRLPLRSNSADVVLSGQAFEHIPFVWVSMTEIARVLKPNGHAFITAPSRGHRHGTQDCWRFYPDGMRALAAWSGLELVEATHRLPTASRLDAPARLLGHRSRDVLGRHRRRLPQARRTIGACGMAAVRSLTKMWANRWADRRRAMRPIAPVGHGRSAARTSARVGRHDMVGGVSEADTTVLQHVDLDGHPATQELYFRYDWDTTRRVAPSCPPTIARSTSTPG